MHSTGVNKIAAKGQILMRIMQYVLAIDIDHPKELQYSLFMLGKSHNHKQIRPWQYSIFVQTMINTLASRLGSNATHDVMAAWVNLFAFVMKTMLPPAIKGLVVETELNSNATAQFVNEDITQSILEVEDEKEMAKSLGSRSLNGSRYGGSRYGGTSRVGGGSLIGGSLQGSPRGFSSSKYILYYYMNILLYYFLLFVHKVAEEGFDNKNPKLDEEVTSIRKKKVSPGSAGI